MRRVGPCTYTLFNRCCCYDYADYEDGWFWCIANDVDNRAAGVAEQMSIRSRQCVSTAGHCERIAKMSSFRDKIIPFCSADLIPIGLTTVTFVD